MDIEPRIRTITFPEVDSKTIFDVIFNQREKIKNEINKEISRLANNDPDEIFRIKKSYTWGLYQQYLELQAEGKLLDFELEKPVGHEPSIAEMALSVGLVILDLMVDSIELGDLNEIFDHFYVASESLGFANGSDSTETINKLRKKAFYSAAAMKRHAENHAIRADALQFYAENIDTFNSMDDAAGKIAGKIVPAKFRTVRDWITQYHNKLRSAGTA